MSETRYRMIFLLLGLALAGVVAFAVVFSPDPIESELPLAVESFSPSDGATVLRQVDVMVDMAVGYEIELFVDGFPIPQTEINTIEATGVRVWVPGPGKTLDEWTPGLHSVLLRYNRITGSADVGEVRWVFRVQ